MFSLATPRLSEAYHPGATLTRVIKTHSPPPPPPRSFQLPPQQRGRGVPAQHLAAPQSPLTAPQSEDDEGQLQMGRPPAVKWVEIGSETTREQAQAIARLPSKMTKRCTALMKQIICCSAQRGSLPLLLSAWVKAMKPRRADWLAVLKEMKRAEHPLFLQVFQFALLEDSFEANARDYTKIIGALAEEQRFQDAEAAFSAMKGRDLAPDQVTLTLMINMFSKAGMFERAKEAFEEIRFLGGDSPDRRAYGSMIMAYIRAGMPEEGETLLREMDAREMAAGREVYKAMLRAYSMAGSCDAAQRIFDAIQLAGVVPDARLCALLIHAYCAARRPEAAMSVLENMRAAGIEPNDKCVAVMVGAFREEGKLDRAVALLMDLDKDGVAIGRETSDALAQWFGQLGLSEELGGILRH